MIRKLNNIQDHAQEEKEEPIHERVEKVFLSSVSHRIRTPLNSIIGFSKLLLNSDNLDSSKKQEFIEMIVESGYELLHYFENILDASDMDAGKFSPNLREINMPQVMTGIAGEYQDRGYSGKPVKVNFSGLNSNTHVKISTDEFILKRIVHNLIEIMLENIGIGVINVFYSADDDIISISVVGKSFYDSESVDYVLKDLFSEHYKDGLDYLSVKVIKQMINVLDGKLYVQNDFNNETSLSIVIPNKHETK